MRRSTRTLLAAAAVLSSCGGTTGPTARTATTTTASAPRPSMPTTYGGVVGAASRQACLEDLRLTQQASDYYAASHGSPAPSVEVLVSSGVLRQAPSSGHGYVITYDAQSGKVGATGACAGP